MLNQLTHPNQLKDLSIQELKALASEIRMRIIDVLSITGGHLSSNLGIVELTIALHRVFDSPQDRLIFDVGHQSYVHKLLTGRNSRFPTIRQTNGLSGFTHPEESIHDHFHSGHAGNALSLALGAAKARDLRGNQEFIIPILGDAALTCGLTLEAMNNIPKKLQKFIVILNDNAMAISKNVGAITAILSRFFNSPTANNLYKELTEIVSKIPDVGETLAKKGNKVKESLKNLVSTAPFFEQFGLCYVGPIDGHDIKQLIDKLEAIKNYDQPTILHVLTVKGQGMENASNNPIPYHGAAPFNRTTGEFHLTKIPSPTFPKIFGKHILSMAEKNPNLIAITPAMPVGSCLDAFMKKYPNRCIDVGIAEGHSVTFAAGLGFGKLDVVACVYSSFLQRSFDNIYHDVCIQRIPLVLAVDRSGLATGDGIATQGIYDISYLNAMPGLAITQPRNGHLLKELLEVAFSWKCPIAIRYPNLPTTEITQPLLKRQFGKGELLTVGKDIVIIALGHMCDIAMQVYEKLLEDGIEVTVIDPIFIKPLDEELLLTWLTIAKRVITIEEHSLQGGLGSIINSFIIQKNLMHLKVLNYGIPDTFIEHGKHEDLLEEFGMSPSQIHKDILKESNLTECVI